jgi:hypothetical protein
LGFDDEMVDLIAIEARRHSETCIQLSVLIKARFKLSVYHPGVFTKLNKMVFISQTHLFIILNVLVH